MENLSMRQHWFEHVRKTRAKMTKAKKEKVSHRDAMKSASVSWAVEKAKIERKLKRISKKNLKAKESS